MKMDASVATSPYKLTVKNLYDESKPINTELVFDPDQASLDFSMNYDLGSILTSKFNSANSLK